MTEPDGTFRIVPFPASRRLMVDGGQLGRQRHTVHGLFEMDVTRARQAIREHKARTGETLSFTAFVTACLGQAVDADRQLHACRNWRGDFVLFDDVDVSTLFEVEEVGRKTLRPHVLRAVNRKSFRDLHDEIRAFQAGHARGPETRWIGRFVRLPGFVRRAFLWLLLRDPRRRKATMGTVAMSAVGMSGSGGFWGIPVPNHTLQVTLGGIAEKPGVADGRITVREYLSVTMSFDHDVVDGAPAARFAERFKALVESAHGLTSEGQPWQPGGGSGMLEAAVPPRNRLHRENP